MGAGLLADGPRLDETTERTLDPADWDGLHALGHRMVDEMLTHMRTVRDRPVWQPMPDGVRVRFASPVPRAGVGAERAYEDFLRDVLPYPVGNTHPRFWGWVLGTGTPLSALAELLAGTMNVNASGLKSAAVDVELQVLAWLHEIMGVPAGSGILTTGGSMANLYGLTAALHDRAGYDVGRDGLVGAARRPMVYASAETHNSVHKSLRLIGLGTESLQIVPVDAELRLDVEALEAGIARDRKAGHQPICLVGNAGTVNTGAFDDLDRLADIAACEDLWLHVDGAFGAWGVLIPEVQHLTNGMHRADSVAMDLHKWLYQPLDVGAVLFRDAAAHRRPFELSAAYLEPMPRGISQATFAERGFELSRGFRALKVWLSLKSDGLDAYAAQMRQNVDQARYLSTLVRDDPDLERVAPAPLNVVCFRYAPPGADPSTLNAVNREIVMQLQESGVAAPSHTTLDERFAVRVAITNHRSRREDFDVLVAAVRRIGEQVLRG